ncbi:hypothetical protein BJ944DRAFT_258149 [Cunninghamella echinulata]|nr:hypothetical protein BJ944DRAFT_258149 [Cunninghamella echinulata]
MDYQQNSYLYNKDSNENQSISDVPVNNINTSSGSCDLPNPVLDISQFNPDIVKQVQQEYWKNQIIQKSATLNKDNSESKNKLEDLLESLSKVSSVTTEVKTALEKMKKETNILQVISTCQKQQNEKERQLYKQRNELLRRHKKELDMLQAKGCIGADITNEKKEFDTKCKMEKIQMDKHIIREMDKEIRSQQEILKNLKVPLFSITKDTDKIALQHQVLTILLQ